LVLLENNHQEVTRAELLQKVWEDVGLEPSENSLNTNISILRKNLSEFGLIETIKTLPRKGFIIHLDQIHFEMITPSVQEVDALQLKNEVEIPAASDELTIKELPKVNSYKLPATIAGIAVLTSMLTLFIFLFGKFLNSTKNDYYFFKRIDKCLVYYIKGTSKENLSAFIASPLGKPVIAGCDHPAVLYYDEVSNYKVKNTLNTIISRCDLNNDGIVDECKNFVSDSYK
jgi:DNA-binding winged-HTH domains